MIAIRHAVDSYNRLHPQGDYRAKIDEPYANERRIWMDPQTSEAGPKAQSVYVTQQFGRSTPPSVTARYDPAPSPGPLDLPIVLQADDRTCAFRSPEGEILGYEEASERVLKPLFFPEEAKLDAIERRERQAAAKNSSIPQA